MASWHDCRLSVEPGKCRFDCSRRASWTRGEIDYPLLAYDMSFQSMDSQFKTVDRYLNQVGYSASQAALLISGAWGILFYSEVTNTRTILKWIISALVTISGILLLGYVSLPSGPRR